MAIRQLKFGNFADALKGMEVGETCEVPAHITIGYLKERCSTLKKEGYLFTTTTASGTPTVTRLR